MMTPREIVQAALRFQSPPRLPHQVWVLPWAEKNLGATINLLRARWPDDTVGPPDVYRPSPRRKGDPFAVGEYTDEWDCVFTGIQEGVCGEVRRPLLPDIEEWRAIQPPREVLPEDRSAARDRVNRFCASTDKFVLAGAMPRPWERYQFIRGSEEALMDMADPDADTLGLLRRIHEHYLSELEFWAGTDVDMLTFMDDWGSQAQLLINPQVWREVFKPLYRDYINLAVASGKFSFMHSDGCIREIYPDLIELGLSAINSQLFTMDLEHLARIARGRLTFWGEIDRQHALCQPSGEGVRECVRRIHQHLYLPDGGIVAQFEAGPGAQPEAVLAVMDEWSRLTPGLAAATQK